MACRVLSPVVFSCPRSHAPSQLRALPCASAAHFAIYAQASQSDNWVFRHFVSCDEISHPRTISSIVLAAKRVCSYGQTPLEMSTLTGIQNVVRCESSRFCDAAGGTM